MPPTLKLESLHSRYKLFPQVQRTENLNLKCATFRPSAGTKGAVVVRWNGINWKACGHPGQNIFPSLVDNTNIECKFTLQGSSLLASKDVTNCSAYYATAVKCKTGPNIKNAQVLKLFIGSYFSNWKLHSSKHYVGWLSSEIACDGFTMWNRNSRTIVIGGLG